MRILTLTNLYPNPLQPHRATFNRIPLGLLGQRHAVRVIAPVLWTDELAAWCREKRRLPEGRRVELDGLTIDHPRYVYPPKVLRTYYGVCFRESVRRTFDRVLREFQPDLLYTPWAYPDGWAAVALGHRARLPVVVKVHGSDVLQLEQYAARRGPTADALRRADAVVAVSRDLAERVASLGVAPERVHVVHDGIDRELFRPGPIGEARRQLGLEADMPIVLCIGNLVPVKAHDVLISACARLADTGVRFACYLIGQGPLRPKLEQQVARLGLDGCVRLVGALPNHALPDWYRAADVFALPSHSEGTPNVLLEAAGCGTPMVASDVGGISDIAHLTPARLVPPRDPRALADALGEFLKSRTGSQERGSGNVRHRSDTVRDMEALFGSLVRARSRFTPDSGHPAPCIHPAHFAAEFPWSEDPR